MSVGRTLVIGDIHGNLRAFDQCLDRSSFNPKEDTLIQLGDVSDRHNDTALVVEKLLNLEHLIAIRGNHDVWTASWLENGKTELVWLQNGGRATIESYEKQRDNIDQIRHLIFFKEIQRDYYIDGENRLFVHAGFLHPKGPEHESDTSICYWDRSLWQYAMNGKLENDPPKRISAFKEIYLGHTPTLNWYQKEPMQAFNVWNLDTGAGKTGRLTIMDIDSKEFWQSD